MRVALTRVLIYTHRWLGIVLGALFIGWFVSGVVMMYARMPRLTPAEREVRLPTLNFSSATIDPATAASAIDGRVSALRLGMADGRPLYRFLAGGRWHPLFADSGEPLPPATPEQALAEARRFAPAYASSARYDGYVESPDQWTLETSRLLPMHRVALGDPADTRLYIAVATGDVVLDTTANERWWAYPGAILHWIYLTPIRRHSYEWGQFIIWSSLAGTLMCVAGLVWGVWRFSPSRRFRLKREPSRSPYAGWMWWHHYLGLLAGAVTLTWIFSGLLSMDPWDWHPSTAPTAAQRNAYSGGTWTLDGISTASLVRAAAALSPATELELVRFRGAAYLASSTAVASLDDGAVQPTFDRGALLASAVGAGGGVAPEDVAWLDEYDAYYYDRDGELPLPVLRVKYHDPQRTWLYVSPVRGAIVRKEERLTRLNRWLYHGLHSLDFPFLYYRRPLWDIVVIVLSLAGLALCVTTIAPAFHRLRRQWIRRRKYEGRGTN